MLVPALLTALALATPAPEVQVKASEAASVLVLSAADWEADSDDNICGLDDLRALSDPAKVDYDALWDATPEIKKMEAEGIDPDSAEGIRLKEAATDRIQEACKDLMDEKGHCSVWKKIDHTDGRKVSDITEEVEKKFPEDVS